MTVGSTPRLLRQDAFKNTRVSLLEEVERWVASPDGQRVLWLCGLAGTGKSTIARTLCELLDKKGLLLATFFISRNCVDRRVPNAILRTLVYECAQKLPGYAQCVYEVLARHPETLSLSLEDQVARLFTEPLEKTRYTGPTLVIVMDALDECQTKDAHDGAVPFPTLFEAIARSSSHVRLLVTSRADVLKDLPDCRVVRLHDIDSAVVAKDIRLYLRTEFHRIATKRHLPPSWPSDEDIEVLVQQTDGLFVYASTVVRYIDHNTLDLRPSKPSPSPSHFALTHRLYMQVLASAVSDEEEEHEATEELLRTALAALVLLEDPLSIAGIARLAGPALSEVRSTVFHLAPVLYYSETLPIRLYHASFPEFVLDPQRCCEERFRVDVPARHAPAAMHCLGVMNGALRRDVCAIGAPDEAVAYLPARLAANMPEEVKYACKPWRGRLAGSEGAQVEQGTQALLEEFCARHLSHWVQVMSLLIKIKE